VKKKSASKEPKPGFAKILADTRKRLADEKKAKVDAKAEMAVKQTSNSAESTASESSSDSDRPPVAVKPSKRSPKIYTRAPTSSSSSSSSDEEELDYSQSLLADLTKNG
jgi:hypothetical protein